ncbi:cytochrome-c oxidase [Bacillus benzoevorans]|uniref:Cbb3-type cytochrome oxidase subunit 1 n=1 Tax=Bacillus benzoevorans TaxID=1456 RepID=A0A7X0HSS2_9BACI|nr:cytochrome-c oxidase [Bacillus benzoevorans]MBB6445247.1 cbb3-type cytochrome oxidase subunit 1 [Bacillus benzoevorans]
MAIRLIQISVIYFVIGVGLGLYMSIVHSGDLMPVHAHVNLLGWMSLALAGVIYSLYPQLTSTKLAKTHFWLHNISLPVMMLSLAFFIEGVTSLGLLISIGATVLVIAIILFALNILLNINRKA